MKLASVAALILLMSLISSQVTLLTVTSSASTGLSFSGPNAVSNASVSSFPTYGFNFWGGSNPTPSGANSKLFNYAIYQKFFVTEGFQQSQSHGANSGWIYNATSSGSGTLRSCGTVTPAPFDLASEYDYSLVIGMGFTGYNAASNVISEYTLSYTNELTTYDATGQLSTTHLRVDTQLWPRLLYNDLLAAYNCYGGSSAWIGIMNTMGSDHGRYIGAQNGYMDGNNSIQDYLKNPYFYETRGNDSSTYKGGTPVVSTAKVIQNIVAFHEQTCVAGNTFCNNYQAWVYWNYANGIQLAINKLAATTGKHLLYFDSGHGLDFTTWPVALNANLTSFIVAGPSGAGTLGVGIGGANGWTQAELAGFASNLTPAIASEGQVLWGYGLCNYAGEASVNSVLNNFYTWAYYGAPRYGQMLTDNYGECDAVTTTSSNEFRYFQSAGVLLDRMHDVGSFFGTNDASAPSALWLENQDSGGQLTQYLSATLGITTMSVQYFFPTLATLEKYSVVVLPYADYGYHTPIIGKTQVKELQAYENAGGHVVILGGFWNQATAPNSGAGKYALQYLVGYNATALTGTLTSKVTSPSSPILSPYDLASVASLISSATCTGGQGCSRYTPLSNSSSYSPTIIVDSTSNGPRIFTTHYGTGTTTVMDPYPTLQNSAIIPLGSYYGEAVLLDNAILQAAGKATPALWGPTLSSPSDPTTGYSILGQKGGPVVAWFFTNSTTTTSASIDLNPTYYGLNGNNCVAVSALDWSVVGRCSNGLLALTDITIPSRGWNPVYIFDGTAANLSPLYENAHLTGSTVGLTSANYSLEGPRLFSSWLIVRSNSEPASVASSSTGAIPKLSSLSSLNQTVVGMHWTGSAWQNLTQTGWYYDSTNSLLYIHLQLASSTTVSVRQGASATSTTTSAKSTTVGTSSTTARTSAASTTTQSVTSGTAISTNTNSAKPFDFQIAVTPPVESVVPGSSVSASVSVSIVSGATEEVVLTASGLPFGTSLKFSPEVGLPSFASAVSLSTTDSTPFGTYAIELTGTAGGLSRSVDFSLTVEPSQPATYTVSVSAGPSVGGVVEPSAGAYSYAAGSSVTVSSTPSAGWHLSSWQVNGKYAGNGTSITLTVTGDLSIQALFGEGSAKTPETATVSISPLAVSSGNVTVDGMLYSLPVSFSWALGSAHTISAPPTISIDDQTREAFNGWDGSVTSKSQTVSFTVTQDMNLQPHYREQYLVSLNFVDGNGKALVPTGVVMRESGETIEVGRNMSAWLCANTVYSFLNVGWLGANVPYPSFHLEFGGPGLYTVPTYVFSDTLKVVDAYGLPLRGATVSLVVGNGTVLTRTTADNGTATFGQVPLGTFSGTVNYLGLSSGVSSQSVGDYTGTVSMVLSYPVLVTLGIMGLFIGVMAYRRWKRNRREEPISVSIYSLEQPF